MGRNGQLKLGLFLVQAGFHEGAWRDPSVPVNGGVDIDHFAQLAALAERAAFHFLFLADSPSVLERDHKHIARVSRNDGFEPITLLSALSSRTREIGLVATATTTYNQPYHLARTFASLDHLSNGRAGWNIVTSGLRYEAPNFGDKELPEHDKRYERAREFVDIVKGLWDTWEDDAFIRDKQSGIFVDTTKLHLPNHRGDYFSVRGPLNIARPPQGYPVLVQAGASEAGIKFAAEVGEVVFTAAPSLEGGKRQYATLKEKARTLGRADDQILIMPGIIPIVGKTRLEASEKLQRLHSNIHIDVAIGLAERMLGFVVDLRSINFDSFVPEALPQTNSTQSTQKLLLDMAARLQLTWRQLIHSLSDSKGQLLVVGTPDEIANIMVNTFDERAADGFNILPAMVPNGLKDFIDLVIPELRRRGQFRAEYSGQTLRENLGLKRPLNRVSVAGAGHPPQTTRDPIGFVKN
ncbi:alkanesulfonate monooxygenase [Bradyrhizobium brasilense]|uniref:Alkanesulfonate monooxygenase n=1 Tax=Bradyrhizobium brasilense TaxID=1419277 RepID=A0A1G6TZ32_9BRAD|nr:LLM class flavin-dependent oxidoreductase [Bradyrhizobium brasilense]SDD33555.1 alkanesulfonate monooxygenase [Bradyrhizobium brasilense]